MQPQPLSEDALRNIFSNGAHGSRPRACRDAFNFKWPRTTAQAFPESADSAVTAYKYTHRLATADKIWAGVAAVIIALTAVVMLL